MDIVIAQYGDRWDLAAVAAATFPLACPPSAAPEDIAAFIAANLSAHCFAEYVSDPARAVLAATDAGQIVGYAMLVREAGDGPDGPGSVPHRPAVELSKMYVLPDYHGTGAATALIRSGIGWACQRGAGVVWLGVNQKNERAQRFYRKQGFEVSGIRSVRLGASLEEDFVMVRSLAGAV